MVQQLVTRLFGGTRVLLGIGHLYNELETQELCGSWDALKVLISFYPESALFSGGRAKKAIHYAQRYAAARGASIQSFAADRRRTESGRLTKSMKGSAELMTSSFIARFFGPRYFPELDTTSPDFEESSLLLTIEAEAAKYRAASELTSLETAQTLAETDGRPKPQNPNSETKSLVKGITRKEPTLVGLLESICTVAEGEQSAFGFDYISMFLRCNELLGRIALGCGDAIKTLVRKQGNHMHSDYRKLENYIHVVDLMLHSIKMAGKLKGERSTLERRIARRRDQRDVQGL